VFDGVAPRFGVKRLAFPDGGEAHAEIGGRGVDDAVHMAANASARDGKAERLAIRFLCEHGKSGLTQPCQRQGFEGVTDFEDA
jgi:hypothetical protein